MTFKCAWTHCNCGFHIYENQPKIKIGKRWYHEECAKEKTLIEDIVTKFIEQINPAEIPVLRKVINGIVFDEQNPRPAEYVMYALDYAIAHPEMKLMYPQGLYRICNDLEVQRTWCMQQADKKVGSHKINIENIQKPTTMIYKNNTKRMVSDLFD